MASPSNVVLLVAACFVVASRAGLIRRNVETADLSKLQLNENDSAQVHSALANHTAAVVELVLQNLHRLKNYQARERLERLVTRFKTLVDELDAQQIHNDYNKPLEQDKHVDDVVAPSVDLNRNSIQADDSFHNEIPHSHRGQLSLTLLPNKDQPKRDGITSRQMDGVKVDNSLKSSKNLVLAPAVTVFHDDAMTTTVSTESDNDLATSDAPQLSLPKANTETVQPRAPETKADDGVEEDESDGNEDDDDDELVSELHQEGFHEEQRIEAPGTTVGNDFYQPMREEDQLIEVNSHRYDPSTNHADARAFGNAKEWNPSPASGSEETEDEEVDDETDNGVDVESNKTERLQYPRQLDEDVKLLNKVISNLRQVKSILERMRLNDNNRR